MLYLGGKGRLGSKIATAILADTPRRDVYVEPFLGGGSAYRHLGAHFRSPHVGDTHEDLMLMWQAAARGWVPPVSISEGAFNELRHSPPSALRGFAGFACAYGGKWYGCYARPRGDRPCREDPDYYAALGSRDVAEIGLLLSRAARIERASYESWASVMSDRPVVYADPPYRGVYSYGAAFDSDTFWEVMAAWADAGASVYVSEYQAPPGWRIIWTRGQRLKCRNGTGATTEERLFTRA